MPFKYSKGTNSVFLYFLHTGLLKNPYWRIGVANMLAPLIYNHELSGLAYI